MKVIFASHAWEDYLFWAAQDRNGLARINDLIEDCRRRPFAGLGKPEPLKGDLRGWWSRRITVADRLVYRVSGSPPDQRLEIAQCRHHY